jgi:molecular chaperone DnaJ
MAQVKRDYYELLGVPRDADDATIKKAFRRLARELHPDVSDDPEAEAKFREIAEAYEVLSKPEARQLYDRYGHEGLSSGGFRPTDFNLGNLSDILSAFFGEDIFGGMGGQPRRRRGGDIHVEVEVDILEAARGVRREVVYTVAAGCGRCGGNGAEPGSELATCTQCGGSGRVQQVSRMLFGEFVTAQVCGRCHGSGRVITQPCTTCDGEGRVAEERRLEVRIPPGIHDGQRIRLTGEGHAGDAGMRPGDAYVLVHVGQDERFHREGDDILSTVGLTMTQAALGATVTVPTLDGELELEFKPGTQPGEVRVLRGRGMPILQGHGRGDHRIVVNVMIPRALTDEQRALLEEFSGTVTDDNHAHHEGFFDRIRAVFH